MSFKATEVEHVEGISDYEVFAAAVEDEVVVEEVYVVAATSVEITEQPASIENVEIGQKYTVSVVATGDGLTYQWKVSTNGGTTWSNTGATGNKTANLTINVTEKSESYRYRCEVTDSKGNVAISDVVTVSLASFNDGVFTYKKTSDGTGIIVAGYLVQDSTLIVPAEVRGLPVTEIGVEAFMNNTNLVSIDLPDTITVIRARAFKGCTSLSSMS